MLPALPAPGRSALIPLHWRELCFFCGVEAAMNNSLTLSTACDGGGRVGTGRTLGHMGVAGAGGIVFCCRVEASLRPQ